MCANSVCVHPGCPSLPWWRGFGLGIKLGACRQIIWTAGARMNLERRSVQIVHSSGKFRAVFCQGPSFVPLVESGICLLDVATCLRFTTSGTRHYYHPDSIYPTQELISRPEAVGHPSSTHPGCPKREKKKKYATIYPTFSLRLPFQLLPV